MVQKKSVLRRSVNGGLKKKAKGIFFFLTPLATAIQDPTTSIRKNVNELRVHEKTIRTLIKLYLSPDLK